MYTVRIATIEEFEKSKEVWNKLASRMPLPSIFCTWEWIYTWWEHFGADYEPLILFVYKNSELKGILPLASHRTLFNREGIIGRILTYCGSRELGPDHLDVITAQEHAEQCIDALCSFLSSSYRDWDVCNLGLSAEDSNLISWFSKGKTSKIYGLDITAKQASFAYFIPINGRFEDYINTLDAKQRYNLRSRKNKLEKEGFAYGPCDPLKEPQGFDTLFEIHALRSRKKKIQSAFSGVDILEFHKSLAKRINNSGWLSLRFLRSEKTVIAASYNFKYQGRVFSYQKGMDPKWERFGPGKAIVYDAIKEAFLTGSKEYNFLQGNEEYKSGWTRECRPLFTVTIYNNTVGGRMTSVLSKLRNLLKKVRTHSAVF
jgi:CelD/BcsL family acetyltransferase involved in cellulose biosynthesis